MSTGNALCPSPGVCLCGIACRKLSSKTQVQCQTKTLMKITWSLRMFVSQLKCLNNNMGQAQEAHSSSSPLCLHKRHGE